MKRNPCRNCYHFPRKSIHLEGSCVTISSRPTVSIHSQCKYTDVIPYLQWEGITFRINGQPCVHAFYIHTHTHTHKERAREISVNTRSLAETEDIPGHSSCANWYLEHEILWYLKGRCWETVTKIKGQTL